MDKFFKALEETNNYKETENGAVALKSTLNKSLDLFATIGALLSRSDSDIISTFLEAYGENPVLAYKMLFYTRDIRGGLGEKRTFKIISKYIWQTLIQMI